MKIMKKKENRFVFDTSGFIYLNYFRNFGEIYTTKSVISEVKDRFSRFKIAAIPIEVASPRKESLEKVKNVAVKTGDVDKLSLTDLEVIALAYEIKGTIVSDDRNVQNVAKILGISFLSLFNKGISKVIVWGKKCEGCGRFFSSRKKKCPFCGRKLKKIIKKFRMVE